MRANVAVVDERGRSVPHVTVWAWLAPKVNSTNLAITGDDLWSIAGRFRSSAEFAVRFTVKPLEQLKIPPMADENGVFDFAMDFERESGLGQLRPPDMEFGFVFMKRGYMPARVDFKPSGESSVKSRVVLEARRDEPRDMLPYMLRFERLRYDLSDTLRNEVFADGATHERIARIRRELEDAAEEAEAAGDKKGAARIRMRIGSGLPSVYFTASGKPVGFKQSDSDTPEARRQCDRAYELDPTHPNIAASYFAARCSDFFKKRRQEPQAINSVLVDAHKHYITQLGQVVSRNLLNVWPEDRLIYATALKEYDPPAAAKVLDLLAADTPWYHSREWFRSVLKV